MKSQNIIIGILALVILALGVFLFLSQKSKVTDNPLPIEMSSQVVKDETQNYMSQFVKERKSLEDFKPSPIEKTYTDKMNGVSFKYPDNFIATSTATSKNIVIVTPPRIYEIASHLETEFYLPALTIELHRNVSSMQLLDKEYLEYKPTAQQIVRGKNTAVQIKTVNGFDGSEFIVELFNTPSGSITATYLNEQFSKNFSSILNSIQTK